ncbi:MAG: threo-3-hydroxy-L-aspartate ammonia-lyase [Rhodothermaceae bacterium]|nr:threo-3-hydroxy-L-aspartate ammonia-lyase [Rhodothermaceae bacterium]
MTFEEIVSAASRLEGKAIKTPVMTSRTVNKQTGGEVYFKCENLQRTGSFKFRGAYNALSQFTKDEKAKGVIAYSSGNHAQGIALAGQLLGIHTTIVMPSIAPEVKLAATKGYGADVVLYDINEVTREEVADQLAAERGSPIIPSFDHEHIIAGQGTAAKELFEEVGELDMLVVCCGGAGLLSGSSISASVLSPQCNVIGVEPEAGNDATRSFKSGMLQTVHNPDTIADGARTPSLGNLTFPLVMEYVSDMVTVNDEELLETMYFMWERMKIVVEPTGALATTAVLTKKVDVTDKRVGVLITGGNVDLKKAAKWFLTL